jgi:hypothetical protein
MRGKGWVFLGTLLLLSLSLAAGGKAVAEDDDFSEFDDDFDEDLAFRKDKAPPQKQNRE